MVRYAHFSILFTLCHPLYTNFHPFLSFVGAGWIMMMGNHLTSIFTTQRLCTANLFMHDKLDWWVEHNAWTGSDLSLRMYN